MKERIFNYRNYKTYLKDFIRSSPNQGRGLRSKISRATGCHTAYISQVLNGHLHFSLEQAHALNRFLKHDVEESHFFLLLLQRERAGTKELKEYFQIQLDEIVRERQEVASRIEFQRTLEEKDQYTYYSNWDYAAVHVVCSLSKLKDPREIAIYLGLTEERVFEVLNFLESVGLVKKSKNHYALGETSLHLGKDSPLVTQHHVNWRMKAVQAITSRSKANLHYSSVISVANRDAVQVREILLNAIERIRPLIQESKQDNAHCYIVDFFPLNPGPMKEP